MKVIERFHFESFKSALKTLVSKTKEK